MNFTTLTNRVLQNVEDRSNDIYSVAEVTDAINDAKDQVFSLVRIWTDEFPQANTTITFAIGDLEKPLPSDFLSILRAQSTADSALPPQAHQVIDFRNQDNNHYNLQALYVRRISDGSYVLGRRYSDQALTVTVYYKPSVADLTSGSSSFSFGPPPADNLIIIKATLQLLGSRKRNTAYWQQREQKMEIQLSDNLKDTNDASPRYVILVED